MKTPRVESRFRHYFPVAAWVIQHTWTLLPAFVLVGVVLAIPSIHYGLSVMCVWLGLVCFWVDRKHLNYCLFTPLQPMATILIVSLGAGISMVVYDSDQKFQYGFLAMQLVGLFGFPLFMAAYFLVTRNVPGFVFPRPGKAIESPFIRPLILIGWFCLLHELGKVVSGVASGTMDRGYAGDFQVETRFGWWSTFGIFLRIQTMAFLLAPLIWRESRLLARVLVAGVVIIILFLHFVAASRGAVILPIFVLVVGCYMFFEFRRLKYEVIFLIGAVAIVPFITIMANYRSTEAFRETDIRNVFRKLSTLKEGLMQKADREAQTGERFAEAGGSFIGVADAMIYEMTPNSIPYEGFGRLDQLIWTFVPYMFSKGQRPVLQDGKMIASEYSGVFLDRSSIEISWPAEMYRRWGWLGVPLGLFAYGLFYGAVFRLVYRFYLLRNALWGFLMCGLSFNFFIGWFFHSVMTTFWFWFYDIPKHLILLGALYWTAKAFTGMQNVPGVLGMMTSDGRSTAMRGGAKPPLRAYSPLRQVP